MRSFYRIRKVLCFLVDCKSPWIATERFQDEMVLYSMTKRLITIAVTGTEEDDDNDNEALVYVKEKK